jgi:dipeptidyl aminopeptidase/acylaminoacyl peptidase
VDFLWVVLYVGLGAALFLGLAVGLLHLYLRWKYMDNVVRIFEEKPLFIIPRGRPTSEAEEVHLQSFDGLNLCGCYLRTTAAQRKGVILFGLEFGSNRWSAVPYCDFLRKEGFDIFAFEPRCQGDSDAMPGYEPLQWVTAFEVQDFKSAVEYLRSRPDADPRGIGLFGLSKGGSAGLLEAARDGYVRCFVTDGIFATHTTMVPYMRKWIAIYNKRIRLQKLLPRFVYSLIARDAIGRIQRKRRCHFPHLERVLGRLAPRPLLMIHGGADNYIKPEMARELFDRAGEPKELWLVEGAKHNQAFHQATEEYQRRVLAFFVSHLAGEAPPPTEAGASKPQAQEPPDGRSRQVSPSVTSTN